MALVTADLNDSQRKTLMNLICQKDIELTALTLQQLPEFLITLFHAPKSILENPSWAHKSGPRSFISIHMVSCASTKATGCRKSALATKTS